VFSLTFSPSGAIVLALGLGVAPALFWLWYYYRKDKHERETQKLIVRAFLLGTLAFIPAGAIEFAVDLFLPFLQMPGVASLAVGMFLVVGPVEEIAKFITVRATVYRDPEFDEVMDGVIYAASAALGFAALENVAYIARVLIEEGLGSGFGTAAVRAILATPGHVAFSGTWGYYLGLYKVQIAQKGIPAHKGWVVWKGLVPASLMHGAWNFIIFYGNTLGYVFLIPFAMIVALIFRSLSRKVKAAQDRSPYRPIESQ
jgi:RsiW-degrading membrane proteinase PrsW (M82 family)